MRIKSTRFGDLNVNDEQIIHFSQGIPGFPGEMIFAVIELDPVSPFTFLQSATDENLTFVMVDPFPFFADYEFVLEDDLAADLGLGSDNLPQIYLIATIREKLADMTVNLLAPIIINYRNRTGQQIILNKPEYFIRQKLFPDGLPLDETKGGK